MQAAEPTQVGDIFGFKFVNSHHVGEDSNPRISRMTRIGVTNHKARPQDDGTTGLRDHRINAQNAWSFALPALRFPPCARHGWCNR